MIGKANMQSILAKLANTFVVILTTVFSGINGTPLDRVVDESTQWNAFDSHLEEKSVVDSTAVTGPRSARLAHRTPGGPADNPGDFASPSAEDERLQYARTFETAPFNAFGAGSSALNSLGHNASIPQLHSYS